MYQACSALRDCMRQLGVGIDGGKDSLTMAAKVSYNRYCSSCECSSYQLSRLFYASIPAARIYCFCISIVSHFCRCELISQR